MSGKLVVLTGRARSGKTTVSRYLCNEHGFVLVKFAGVLKDMLYTLGLDWDQVEGGLKEHPCELLGGKTPRHAMQTLGTEWGRDMIHQDLWVNAWRQNVQQHLDQGLNVVTDDCRFDNELAAAMELDALVIKLVRPQTENDVDAGHSSESVPEMFHWQVDNTEGILALQEQIKQVLCLQQQIEMEA
jgi:hypothetical protein